MEVKWDLLKRSLLLEFNYTLLAMKDHIFDLKTPIKWLLRALPKQKRA